MMKPEAFNQHQIAKKRTAASLPPAMQGSMKHVTRHLGSISIDALRLGTPDEIPREKQVLLSVVRRAVVIIVTPLVEFD
jgi:hypothetical protein